MEKVVKLAGKELKLHSSLFTIIDYRNVFGSELFSDVSRIEKLSKKETEDYSLLIDLIFKLTYILHKPYTKYNYEEFLKSLDFNVISDIDSLQELSNAIGEMLGTLNNDPPFSE